ncbi:acetyltransferase [Luteimonas sp. MJ293]|uniref:acetyltransferase n=1 Tax=Luteimonas sp. MJ146 TaxID=3129240 RepID=UPI0031BA7A50
MNSFHFPVPEFKRLMIFGAGGFGREMAWLARQCREDKIEVSFVVDRPEYLTGDVNEIPVRLLDDCESTPDVCYVVALGDPAQRRKAVAACEARGLHPTILVHPRVEASDTVVLGIGSVVCAGSILTVNIEIGEHVQVNLSCTIGHDVRVGKFSTLSPGVHVSGNVRIGEGVFIGTGASIINGHPGAPLVIGDGAVIAAGSCVIKPVEPGSMVAGVPAARKR